MAEMMHMLNNVFLKTLRDWRRSLPLWGIGLALLSLWVIALYPTIGETYAEILEDVPSSLEIFLGDVSDLSTPAGYLGAEMFSFMTPLVFLVLLIAFGSGTIAREEERGTLDLLLSTPVSRRRVLTEKFAAMVVIGMLLAAIMWLGLVIGAEITSVDISYLRMLEATFSGLLLGIVFGTLAIAVSCLTGRRGWSIGSATVIAIASYLLNAFAPLVDVMEPYRKISPFYYYNGGEPLVNGLDPVHVAVLLGLIVVLLAVSLVAFQRRDLAV